MNKVNEKRREAHEKWSCLIPRAAAALFLYITSQREHLGGMEAYYYYHYSLLLPCCSLLLQLLS